MNGVLYMENKKVLMELLSLRITESGLCDMYCIASSIHQIECCLATIHQSSLLSSYSVLVFIISQPPPLFLFHFYMLILLHYQIS